MDKVYIPLRSHLLIFFVSSSYSTAQFVTNRSLQSRRMSISSQHLHLLVLLISLSGFSIATPSDWDWHGYCCSKNYGCCLKKP
ncbi:hypothetical protein Pst134EA_024693 [Puccinia striiformis f. sp. tritici]|uniref:hypothetical protein n=1 Tax=Puccinia striiformis f. sp. tritici TaxID=168172 RepID=UPI002007A71B|nr:hypothetical protein Pst134EA_024693 [Puccinia striiformis f. sp. tritici]KAH9453828.1 hypothetical protein Pst134EA_024693 [Puccinia striiformis f. sp. tritici]